MSYIAPPADRPKRRTLVVGVVAFLVGFGTGAVSVQDGLPEATTSPDGITTQADENTPAPAYAPPPPPPELQYGEPTATDFALTVYETSRECFGSAGCLVEFTIDITNITGIALDPTKTYALKYEIAGADEQLVDTLELTGDQYSGSEEMIEAADGAELGATVLDVRER